MKDRLRAVFCDHLSIIRGKYLPNSKIGDDSTRFCRSTFGVHFDRDLLDAPGAMMMQGLPDMELIWKGENIRDSWDEATKIVIGDLFDHMGNPLALCPRGALKRAINVWTDKGLYPKIGIELEAFAMVKNDEGKIVPYDTPGAGVYGTGPFADPLRFNDDIWQTADKLGFSLDMITAEYDTPQFEYTLTFDDALKAVDDIILFRLMAREIAFEYGIILTFLPKPIAEAGGSGMHINFSFTDKDGNNAFATREGKNEQNMNNLSKGCVSGLIYHHKALSGLIAPTKNSYDRLQPGSLSGYWKNWGGDHRNVTTRVSTEGGSKARLEHRMADAASNPYTSVAAILHAANLGVQNNYSLPAIESGNGFDRTDATEGTADSLGLALKDLSSDKNLINAVGTELIDNHIFMREMEVTKTENLEGDDLLNFYINFI